MHEVRDLVWEIEVGFKIPPVRWNVDIITGDMIVPFLLIAPHESVPSPKVANPFKIVLDE